MILPARPFGRTPAAAASRSAARAAKSGGGRVLEPPPTLSRRLRYDQSALSPCSGRLVRPIVLRRDSVLEIVHEAVCTDDERASRRPEAWRKHKPHRVYTARQD